METRAEAVVLKQTYRRPRTKYLLQEEKESQQRLHEGRLRMPTAAAHQAPEQVSRDGSVRLEGSIFSST